jgi:hypothetical protein
MRPIAPAMTVLSVLLLVAGCGDDGGGGADGDSSAPEKIDITFSGDSVEPNGERVEVDAGQKVELVVKADAPGEIHVHSTPEQELEYGKGTTTLTLTIDQPGVVEVESHDLEKTILQLEVR